MSRFRLFVLAALALGAAAPARAQVFGQFLGAEPVPVNGRLLGAYVHSSEDVVGLLAQLRQSFYPGVDFSFQGGISRQDLARGEVTTVRLGTGFKVQAVRQSDANPVAIAVGGDLEVRTGDNFNLLTLGPHVTASHTFTVGQGGGITPYARTGLAFMSIDVGDRDDTDISVPTRLGGEFRVTPQLRIAFELQLHLGDTFNDNLALAGGVNLPF